MTEDVTLHTSHIPHILEASAYFESKNYAYWQIDELIRVYKRVVSHIGWRDTRRDKRFVVKYHDVFRYMPARFNDESSEQIFLDMFGSFCSTEYEQIQEQMEEHNIDEDQILGKYAGHYCAFTLDIDEITEDNALDITCRIYDDNPYIYNEQWLDDHIFVVDMLKREEEHYMQYWVDFIKGSGCFTDADVAEIIERYNANNKDNPIK